MVYAELTKFDFDVSLEPDNVGGRLGVADEALEDEFLVLPRLDPCSRRVVQNFHATRRNCFSINDTTH